MGRIASINISGKKRVPKDAGAEAELVPGMRLAGDAHAGPGERQGSLLMLESIVRQRKAIEGKNTKWNGGRPEAGYPESRARPLFINYLRRTDSHKLLRVAMARDGPK